MRQMLSKEEEALCRSILNTLNEGEYMFLQVLVIACRDINENGAFNYDDSNVLKQYTRRQYAGYCRALSKKQIITMYGGSCYHDGALKRLFNEYFKGLED